MPSATFVDPDLRLGMARVEGSVTGTEIANASVALYADADWRSGFDEIWDLSEVRVVDVTPDEMSVIVRYEQDVIHRVGTVRVALIMTRDVVRIIGTLYQRLAENMGRSVEVTRTVEEGAAWLGLDGVPAWFGESHEG